MSPDDRTIALMAAQIYSARILANPERHRRDTLRRAAIEEAIALWNEAEGSIEENKE